MFNPVMSIFKKLHDKFEIQSDQGLVSSTFYEKLFRAQIPKAQKDTDGLNVFSALLGSERVRALSKTLVKLTPDCYVATRWLKNTSRDT